MPIRPKHTPSEGRPVAQRQFTDREDFIKTFQFALAGKHPDKHHVLVFYGVGGIGKTSLRKELAKLIAEQDDVTSAVLDFETPGYRDMETALFALRKSLLVNSKVHFPTFDIAYAVYWQKTRPQTPMTGDNLSLMTDSMVLSDLLSAAGVVPIIGVLPRLPYLLAKGRKVLQDWWTRRGSEELKELPSLEPPRIAERLPMFWASDLKDYLAAKGSKAVLFLDTYEALTEAERSEGKLYQRDEWVRELVAQLPGVLWVVCGREMLRWAELDPDWKESLDQHLVGGLADADARRFLKSCGIEDSSIADTIVRGSTGLPYYLDLAVDTYLEAQRRGLQPSPADFAHTPSEVFTRFLRHLTQPEIETLKVLSIPRYWDTELFKLLITEYQTGYPLTAYDDLCRFSFINESTSKGTYTMHQLMRQSLQEHESPELVKRVHRFLFELHDGQLKDIDTKNVTDRQKAALAEAFYHGRAILPVQEFFKWFQKIAEQLRTGAQHRLLLPLREQLGLYLEAELGPEHPDVAANLHGMVWTLEELGKIDEAERTCRRALAIREKALGPEHPDVAASLVALGYFHRGQGKRAEAESLLRRALTIQEKALGPEHPDLAECLAHLAWLLTDSLRYAEAEPLARRALAIEEKARGPEYPGLAPSLWGVADLLYFQGKYAEGERLLRRALAIQEKALGAEDMYVGQSLLKLGSNLVEFGRYAEAEPMLRRGLAIWQAWFGPEHPYLTYPLVSLGRVCEETGRKTEAEGYFRKALATVEGQQTPAAASLEYTLCALGDFLARTGRYAEAEPLLQRALALQEKSHGPDSPVTAAESIISLAELRRLQGRLDESEQLLQRSLLVLEETPGPEYLIVTHPLYSLAETRLAQGKTDEAEALFKRALAIREKAGAVHPIRLPKVLDGLARVYEQTGRTAEAQQIRDRIKAIREKNQQS
jgi:tetratricopeptide (TPR) repeat protein